MYRLAFCNIHKSFHFCILGFLSSPINSRHFRKRKKGGGEKHRSIKIPFVFILLYTSFLPRKSFFFLVFVLEIPRNVTLKFLFKVLVLCFKIKPFKPLKRRKKIKNIQDRFKSQTVKIPLWGEYQYSIGIQYFLFILFYFIFIFLFLVN